MRVWSVWFATASVSNMVRADSSDPYQGYWLLRPSYSRRDLSPALFCQVSKHRYLQRLPISLELALARALRYPSMPGQY
jgi:hypothetical protein